MLFSDINNWSGKNEVIMGLSFLRSIMQVGSWFLIIYYFRNLVSNHVFHTIPQTLNKI